MTRTHAASQIPAFPFHSRILWLISWPGRTQKQKRPAETPKCLAPPESRTDRTPRKPRSSQTNNETSLFPLTSRISQLKFTPRGPATACPNKHVPYTAELKRKNGQRDVIIFFYFPRKKEKKKERKRKKRRNRLVDYVGETPSLIFVSTRRFSRGKIR